MSFVIRAFSFRAGQDFWLGDFLQLAVGQPGAPVVIYCKKRLPFM